MASSNDNFAKKRRRACSPSGSVEKGEKCAKKTGQRKNSAYSYKRTMQEKKRPEEPFKRVIPPEPKMRPLEKGRNKRSKPTPGDPAGVIDGARGRAWAKGTSSTSLGGSTSREREGEVTRDRKSLFA